MSSDTGERAQPECLDARGQEGWTCIEYDGTGLWCANCLAETAPPRTWRVFCEAPDCSWHREMVASRDEARRFGKAHSEQNHPDEFAFRVQGLSVETSWQVLDDEERPNIRIARQVLQMVHALDAVPFTADSDLDTDVWLHLFACHQSLDFLAQRVGIHASANGGPT